MVRQTSRSGGHVKWVVAKSAGFGRSEGLAGMGGTLTGRAGRWWVQSTVGGVLGWRAPAGHQAAAPVRTKRSSSVS
jgi:hypothetical protein